MSEEIKREQAGDQEIENQNPENSTVPNQPTEEKNLQSQEVETEPLSEAEPVSTEEKVENLETEQDPNVSEEESSEIEIPEENSKVTPVEDVSAQEPTAEPAATEATKETEEQQTETSEIETPEDISNEEPLVTEAPIEDDQPEAPEAEKLNEAGSQVEATSSESEPVEKEDKPSGETAEAEPKEENAPESNRESSEKPKIDEEIVSEEGRDESNDSAEATSEPEEEPVDYSTFSREELVVAAEELSQQEHVSRTENTMAQIVPLFREMEKSLKETALNKFIVDGGNVDDFEYQRDELFSRFNVAVRNIRDKRARYIKDREANKEKNLEKKEALLDRLRTLVDGEEATTNIAPIKEIQQEWRAIGPVPNQHNRTLWANYNALLDRFYNNRHILFELKELDRKKNHKLKEELCVKAESLNELEDIKSAIVQLNELHEEYKKIGAVPREIQESLWKRFKAASDEIYMKRKVYLESLKGELNENLVKKRELAEAIKEFISFDSDRINEWNAKTKEVIAIQKKWEALGGLPREYAKEVNKEFWGAFKTFFSHKNNFFKKLEGQRKVNLETKQQLVEEARALKDSEDWNKTADKIKELQRKWKEVGPVPEKSRNSVYAEFKEACDEFFNNRRANLNKEEEGYGENLTKKEELCAQIEAAAEKNEGSPEDLDEFVNQWKEIGFVPKNSIKKIDTRFQKALETFVSAMDVAEEDREGLIMKAQLSGLGKGPNADRNLQKKEGSIRRQIQELEDNINLWNNNLAFFANSKTADKLKVEFDQKIEKAQEEVRKLKKQLRLVRSI